MPARDGERRYLAVSAHTLYFISFFGNVKYFLLIGHSPVHKILIIGSHPEKNRAEHLPKGIYIKPDGKNL